MKIGLESLKSKWKELLLMNSFRSHMIIFLMLNNRSIILSHFNPQNDISPFTGDENMHFGYLLILLIES